MKPSWWRQVIRVLGRALLLVSFGAATGLTGWSLLALLGIVPAPAPGGHALGSSDLASMAVAGATLLLATVTVTLAFVTGGSLALGRAELALAEASLKVVQDQATKQAEQVAASQMQVVATQELATETQKQVVATQTIAEEAVRERSARWEPMIAARLVHVPGNRPQAVVLENLGTGPALDVVYVAVVSDPIGMKAWFIAGPLNLHSDTSYEQPLNLAYGIEQTSYETSDTSSAVNGVQVRRFVRRFMRAFEGDAQYRGQVTEPTDLIGLAMPPAVLFDRPQQLSGPVDGREEACLCRCANGHIHRALTHLRIPQEEFDPNDSTHTWLDWYKRIALSGLAAPRMPPKPNPTEIRSEPL